MEGKQIDFNRRLRRQVVGMIQNHDARLVIRQSQRVSIWDVLVLGIPCRVVYDGMRRNIVTVLPEEETHRKIPLKLYQPPRIESVS